MPIFGKFSEITFVDGASPPINADNLNELERVVALTDAELAKSDSFHFAEWVQYYFERNTYQFEYFSDSSGWTIANPAVTTVTDEPDDQIIGDSAIKVVANTASANYISIYKTLGSSIDLTKFNDDGASGIDDCIVLCVYASDASDFSAFELRIGDDFSNCYFIDLISLLQDGWNALRPQKSDFSTVGAPTGWDTISYIRIAPAITAGHSGEYFMYNLWQLVRQDPTTSYLPNPLQKYTGSAWEKDKPTYIAEAVHLFRDWQNMIELPGLMRLSSDTYVADIQLYGSTINFISKFEFYCKYAGEGQAIMWYHDSNNYLKTYITSDTLYIYAYEAGVGTSTNVALDNALMKNERYYMYVEKDLQTFRSILYKDGEPIKILEYETSIASDDSGYVYLVKYDADTFTLLTDYWIGRRALSRLQTELMPRYAYQMIDQDLVSNTLVDANGLWMYIPPFTTIKVDLYIVCIGTSTTPDIKVRWNLTTINIRTQRHCLGPYIDQSDTTQIAKMRLNEYAHTTAVYYGVGTVDETVIHEECILHTADSAGKIQIEVAQNSTDAGNPTTLKSRSHFTVIPIFGQAQNNYS